jgi:hypothetical protein
MAFTFSSHIRNELTLIAMKNVDLGQVLVKNSKYLLT